ncbi:gamma-glutamylcyclotransferase-like [Colias croceus]|uniref:gamma-glutamylcyclotransferase-like n=1 Tax=Colias crocea TaxID=72248 RepID=UPI001E27ECC4|nr:gamma-glutamylcyclotransferase-like [Colias croceus]
MQLILLFLILYNVLLSTCNFSQHERKFLYFAYGSNLLDRRMRINSPSAVFITPAKLPHYRLDFDKYLANWRGAVATIAEHYRSDVWGAIWAIDISEIAALDGQEGVHRGLYYPKYVKILTPEGHEVTARTYQLINNPPVVSPENLAPERRPSNTYLQVIALGAYQCGLPAHYIGYIYTFPTNGQIAVVSLRKQLGYPFNTTHVQNM